MPDRPQGSIDPKLLGILWHQPKHLFGPDEITITAGRPDNRRRDADNLCKSLLDLLTEHGVIEDDSRVMRITSGRDRRVPGGRVHIIVKPALADVEPA